MLKLQLASSNWEGGCGTKCPIRGVDSLGLFEHQSRTNRRLLENQSGIRFPHIIFLWCGESLDYPGLPAVSPRLNQGVPLLTPCSSPSPLFALSVSFNYKQTMGWGYFSRQCFQCFLCVRATRVLHKAELVVHTPLFPLFAIMRSESWSPFLRQQKLKHEHLAQLLREWLL